jgi:hypothetical protein
MERKGESTKLNTKKKNYKENIFITAISNMIGKSERRTIIS